jgi:hypothetical protein
VRDKVKSIGMSDLSRPFLELKRQLHWFPTILHCITNLVIYWINEVKTVVIAIYLGIVKLSFPFEKWSKQITHPNIHNISTFLFTSFFYWYGNENKTSFCSKLATYKGRYIEEEFINKFNFSSIRLTSETVLGLAEKVYLEKFFTCVAKTHILLLT